MSTASFPLEGAHARSRARGYVPWTVWAGVAAVTSANVGGAWDLGWHRSVGRDAFLTPPHLLIYACGVIAAILCAYLMFVTTFGHSQAMRGESVRVLGFRAPLGAFIMAWGGFAMLTSAPFDNWWHAAYGLDVKLLSPPHVLLISGIRAVAIGVLFLIVARLNRSRDVPGQEELHRRLRAIFLYMGGLMVAGQMFFIMEQTWDVMLHRMRPYEAIGIALPVVFAVFARTTGSRWSSTIAAATYTALVIAEILIFPLVPASPKLGPVTFATTHLVPAKFPILLIVPALGLDLLWQRTRGWPLWRLAIASGVAFTLLLVAAEWPFATFLMSHASENRFFGTIYFDYNSVPTSLDRLRVFFRPVHGAGLAAGLVLASVLASLSALLGLSFGDWMRGVER